MKPTKHWKRSLKAFHETVDRLANTTITRQRVTFYGIKGPMKWVNGRTFMVVTETRGKFPV